jgi:hypothetical protein
MQHNINTYKGGTMTSTTLHLFDAIVHLKGRLAKASHRVGQEGIKINAEFEAIENDPEFYNLYFTKN